MIDAMISRAKYRVGFYIHGVRWHKVSDMLYTGNKVGRIRSSKDYAELARLQELLCRTSWNTYADSRTCFDLSTRSYTDLLENRLQALEDLTTPCQQNAPLSLLPEHELS